MVWYGMVWYGMVWHGMVWYGMAWYGMVWSELNFEYNDRSKKMIPGSDVGTLLPCVDSTFKMQ